MQKRTKRMAAIVSMMAVLTFSGCGELIMPAYADAELIDQLVEGGQKHLPAETIGETTGLDFFSGSTMPNPVYEQEENCETGSVAEPAPQPPAPAETKPAPTPEEVKAARLAELAQTVEPLEKTVYAVTSVNVRELNDKDSDILGVAGKGDAVKVTGITGDWYRVDWNGKEGYSYSEYYSNEKPLPPAQDPARKLEDGNAGRLTIPELGISVRIYDCPPGDMDAQTAPLEAPDSAYKVNQMIGDHCYQEFGALYGAKPGMKMQVTKGGVLQREYTCYGTEWGSNIDHITYMANGDYMYLQNTDGLILFTCQSVTSWNTIFITLWN